MRFVCGVLVSAAIVVCAPSVLHAQTLVWDPSPDPAVTGYRLFYGTQSGVYTNQVDVGNVVLYQPPSGFDWSITRYFAVLAYTSSDLTSSFSNEVSGFPRTKDHQPPTERQLSVARGTVCRGLPLPPPCPHSSIDSGSIENRMDTGPGLQCNQHLHVDADASGHGGTLRRSSMGSSRRVERPIRMLAGNGNVCGDGPSLRAFSRCRLSYATWKRGDMDSDGCGREHKHTRVQVPRQGSEQH